MNFEYQYTYPQTLENTFDCKSHHALISAFNRLVKFMIIDHNNDIIHEDHH